jgi:hypothetical protein
MNSKVIIAGESRWNPSDISRTNPSGAKVTIHPNIDNPVYLPFVTFIRLPTNSRDDANQYAVTAVMPRAKVIHKNTFAIKVLVTGKACDDLYSWSMILNPLIF